MEGCFFYDLQLCGNRPFVFWLAWELKLGKIIRESSLFTVVSESYFWKLWFDLSSGCVTGLWHSGLCHAHGRSLELWGSGMGWHLMRVAEPLLLPLRLSGYCIWKWSWHWDLSSSVWDVDILDIVLTTMSNAYCILILMCGILIKLLQIMGYKSFCWRKGKL